ncbi:MAG: MarR family transcriptional regulator [Microbacterium sp.]
MQSRGTACAAGSLLESYFALRATGNVGEDRVNPGELAVLEDIADHPRSTIREITDRTGLAQILVSRIVHHMAETGALTVETDRMDKRKVRSEIASATREVIRERAGNSIESAVAAATPALTSEEQLELVRHLAAAAALLNRSSGRAYREA